VDAWPLLTRIWRLQRALVEEATPCIAEQGLSPKDLMLLALVERIPHAGALARELHLPAPSVSHALKRLEGAGLVERRSDASDLRRFVFELTPRGREALAAGSDCLTRTMRARLARLAPAERSQLNHLLERLLEDDA